MNKKDLLLEIGLEEMPARFVTNSMNQLSDKVKSWLLEKKISFEEISAFSSPRRLAVLVRGVDTAQEDINEEAKGPAKKIALTEDGEWSKAAIGFSRGQGASIEDIFFKEINGIEYAHVSKFIKGQETAALLPELQQIITSLSFPKNMRWANQDLRFIRPVKWLIALFGNEVIPFSITNVQTSNLTRGHRFLGEEIEINNPADYEKALLAQYVITNPQERKSAILSQLEKIEEEHGWVVPVDEDLLEEVNNLVEYPTALYGKFEEEYLELPEEVLITSMKEHQRYFPVKSKDGTLLPYFVTVRNGSHEHLEKVAKGNEKVLRARLSDAAFFYREDQKTDISASLEKLNNIVYHEEIGTLAEKVNRVRQLAAKLSEILDFSGEAKAVTDRAAEISKFDLVSHMVYEFPELQGFMGEKYALQKGEKEAVARAINEHYMPRNAEDQTPESDAGAVLSIAEKLDTIVSSFAIGIIPSGSQDPYALRRQASGIIQTLLAKHWDLKLEELIALSLETVLNANIGKKSKNDLMQELVSFFKLRIKYMLQEKAIRYDLIEAVLGNDIGSVPSLVNRAQVLESSKDADGFKESIEALSRVINIASKAEDKGDIDSGLFENENEKALFSKYLSVTEELKKEVKEEEAFNLLISLKPEIDQYFEHTMVMDENQEIRRNRLHQMAHLSDVIKKFANMNEIIVK
ncbi:MULTISPECIES: glycine--tRNA ligase subunit beta [Bacillaceae]|uniref:Glycine--tRNA ligase beta subunit n=1 Tax=Cytobacillus firmus TaxID=1399 RepID=A0AA46PWP5_CYTFI|nr:MULTISPECIES: glycine--tRNA ligase subunit beta [Bacillaceae]KML37906.1 glycine-tRNA synthetase subunit beta [Cytobacillus firmus]MBG9445606.1 glycine-tRNA synthetase subunit beta [Cytobacillus firmus]UYG94525.1 glycine--tRNA ligase subunit beta [Cytobacillus firmus]